MTSAFAFVDYIYVIVTISIYSRRGSDLAEFLTDGDPKGDLMKNVEELREYNPKGLELCRTLATHYSKQLFAIYKNKEDPFFLPP